MAGLLFLDKLNGDPKIKAEIKRTPIYRVKTDTSLDQKLFLLKNDINFTVNSEISKVRMRRVKTDKEIAEIYSNWTESYMIAYSHNLKHDVEVERKDLVIEEINKCDKSDKDERKKLMSKKQSLTAKIKRMEVKWKIFEDKDKQHVTLVTLILSRKLLEIRSDISKQQSQIKLWRDTMMMVKDTEYDLYADAIDGNQWRILGMEEEARVLVLWFPEP